MKRTQPSKRVNISKEKLYSLGTGPVDTISALVPINTCRVFVEVCYAGVRNQTCSSSDGRSAIIIPYQPMQTQAKRGFLERSKHLTFHNIFQHHNKITPNLLCLWGWSDHLDHDVVGGIDHSLLPLRVKRFFLARLPAKPARDKKHDRVVRR